MFCSCGTDLHNGQEEFWTIPLYKTVSVQQYSWDVWCELLTWGHATASQLDWGQNSRRHIFICWSHSVVDLLQCFGSLSCCITQLLLSFNWGTEPDILLQKVLINLGIHFSVDDSKLSWPWGSKTAKTMMLPPPYFTVGMRFWCWCAVPFFSPHIVLCVPSKQLKCRLICPQNILPEAL